MVDFATGNGTVLEDIGLNHALYQQYPDQVKSQLQERADSDGMITLQDLVDVKIWVADQAGEDPIVGISQGETSLLFIMARGDLNTRLVPVDNVLTCLFDHVEPPGGLQQVNWGKFTTAQRLGDWTRN